MCSTCALSYQVRDSVCTTATLALPHARYQTPDGESLPPRTRPSAGGGLGRLGGECGAAQRPSPAAVSLQCM